MRPIRVLYLIDSLGPGGAQRQLVTLVRSLDRTLVTPEVAVYHPLFHFRPELEAADVPVNLLVGSGGRDPRVLVGLIRLLARERFDILHSYLSTPGTLARLAAPFSKRTRVVISERNVDLGHSRARLTVERVLSRRGDAMIANAHAIASEVERLVPAWSGRVNVVPNGLDWSEPTEAERAAGREFRIRHIGNADILLGVVARVERQKAPDVLVDALEMIPDPSLLRLKVVWVGPRIDTALVSSIESRLEGSGLANRMVFLGETRDTRSVYLGVHGLILCSRWEGLPNAVLEALAHGCPVIATDVGDVRRLLPNGRGGWIVQSDDSRALSMAIKDLVDTPEVQLVEMGRDASDFVLDEYSAARLASRTVSVYRNLLAGSRRCD